ncbi:MAG: AAA family ATPase [Kiritimatiellae bacterium]|nr:AAA family ATPase [Kiritimatiellia bacterium]
MKLHIENFARISSADIAFDGLTVIAGKNNMGKSTVGKVLYTFFRALSQMPRRVRRDRIDAVVRAFERNVDRSITAEQAQQLLDGSATVEAVYQQLREADRTDALQSLFAPLPEGGLSEFSRSDIAKTIADVKAMDDRTIAGKLAYQVLDCVFHRQTRPLREVDGDAVLQLFVHGERNEMRFGKGGSSIHHVTQLVKKVRLIANPDVLSLLNIRDLHTNKAYAKAFEKYTLELAQELAAESRLSAAEEESARSRLAEILALLDGEICGNLILDDENDFALLEDGASRPTKAENLSMGMKFFVLLRFMLLHGVLQDRDVLILDEPENHLHPIWQIVYAKVLVLLQKEFNLTILLTSHSAFFVNAVRRFSIVELDAGAAHFYRAKADAAHPGFITFEDVSAKPGPIFREFSEAYGLVDAFSGAEGQDGESLE